MANFGGKPSMTLDKARAIFEAANIAVLDVARLSNDYGWVLILDNGGRVSIYDTGKYLTLGEEAVYNKRLLEEGEYNPKFDAAPAPVAVPAAPAPAAAPVPARRAPSASAPRSPNAGRVYLSCGRDMAMRYQLENILRQWGLEWLDVAEVLPFREIEGDLPEDEARFAIVLAASEDVGFAKGRIHERRYRARQNVVFELGFLLAKLGRDRVAVLYPAAEKDFEKPADMPGLHYIPFKDNLDDAKEGLKRLLVRGGYRIILNSG